jgi:hypothetical protein
VLYSIFVLDLKLIKWEEKHVSEEQVPEVEGIEEPALTHAGSAH